MKWSHTQNNPWEKQTTCFIRSEVSFQRVSVNFIAILSYKDFSIDHSPLAFPNYLVVAGGCGGFRVQ